MARDVIGIMGFKGSGKDTAAQILVAHGYQRIALSDALKDTMSTIFGWDRAMLEGDTKESREWREQVDSFWAERLGVVDFTPRKAMTSVGNDILKLIHPEIWVAVAERRIQNSSHDKFVITDCRFLSDTDMIKRLGGRLIRIHKLPEPEYVKYSSDIHPYDPLDSYKNIRSAQNEKIMETTYAHIHRSEWEWNRVEADFDVFNNGTIPELHQDIINKLKL